MAQVILRPEKDNNSGIRSHEVFNLGAESTVQVTRTEVAAAVLGGVNHLQAGTQRVFAHQRRPRLLR